MVIYQNLTKQQVFTNCDFIIAKMKKQEMKTYISTKTCTQTFTAGLFMLAKKGKHPNVRQLIDIYTKCGISTQWNIICHIINKALIHTTTEMNLEHMQSQRGQIQKATYWTMPLYEMFRIHQTAEKVDWG